MQASSFRRHASALAGLLALQLAASAAAQTLSDADRANLQIQTAHGNPVHMGDTLDQVRAALPSAPPPQIPGRYATLWDQVDGIILRLSNDVVVDILYDRKSQAKLAGLAVGIESPLADLEQTLGASQAGLVPNTRTWALDARRQLVANVSEAGVVTNLQFRFIPKPMTRASTGAANLADARVMPAPIAPIAPEPLLTGEARRARLDELLAQRDDGRLLQLVFPQFAHQPALSADVQAFDLAWLEAHADGGRASVLYALSWKLLPADRDRAREANARARIEWMLASAQCARPPQPGPLMFMLEGEAIVDVMPLRRDSPAWPLAIEHALAWDHALPAAVEADWYCGAGNVKPPADAAVARQAYWQRIRDTNHPKTATVNATP